MKKLSGIILSLLFFEISFCQVQKYPAVDTAYTVNDITHDFNSNYYLFYNSSNAGYKAYKNKMFTKAYGDMKTVTTIHDMYDTRDVERIQNRNQFDTIAAKANLMMADCLYYTGKYEEAISLFKVAKNNSITNVPYVYAHLIAAYRKQKDTAEAFRVLEEAKNIFPDDTTIKHSDLNYHMAVDNKSDLARKFEEAALKEPNNATIEFNLATIYLSMANPTDGSKPDNESELIAKSVKAYQHALKLSPKNASYNYNFGALYFNQATEINDQMNNIIGTTAANNKKYKGLKSKRDALFTKSAPYFENAYKILLVTEKHMSEEDKETYKNTILALKEIYDRQNKLGKAAAMKKKYASLQ
ncbi:MAG TPA: hypothetical protein VK588_01740 [Chitinophagaceae bacterium]|nr:hypothetical protein [Chitinophagaceae bacterium]